MKQNTPARNSCQHFSIFDVWVSNFRTSKNNVAFQSCSLLKSQVTFCVVRLFECSKLRSHLKILGTSFVAVRSLNLCLYLQCGVSFLQEILLQSPKNGVQFFELTRVRFFQRSGVLVRVRFIDDAVQWCVKIAQKGGKFRNIFASHDCRIGLTLMASQIQIFICFFDLTSVNQQKKPWLDKFFFFSNSFWKMCVSFQRKHCIEFAIITSLGPTCNL